MMRATHSKLAIVIAAVGLTATASIASAQGWYMVNRHPAPYGLAQKMSAQGLPYGRYWLRTNGDWGIEGDRTIMGNLYGREPSASDVEQSSDSRDGLD
jgi:hypothetical protein